MEALKEITNESEQVQQIDEMECFSMMCEIVRNKLPLLQFYGVELLEKYTHAACSHNHARDCLSDIARSNRCDEHLDIHGRVYETDSNQWKESTKRTLNEMENAVEDLLESIREFKNSEGLNPCCFEKQGFAVYEMEQPF